MPLLSSPFPDTEDASETDLAKHDEDDYVEIKEQWVFGQPWISCFDLK